MIEKNDNELIDEVLKLGTNLFKKTNESSRHTVVAGIRAKSGKYYFGANCDSVHGTCAEVVAYVNAVLAGDFDLETIVAASVRGQGLGRIIEPCGNCRQIMVENIPDINVIVCVDGELEKIKAKDLLPLVYVKRN